MSGSDDCDKHCLHNFNRKDSRIFSACKILKEGRLVTILQGKTLYGWQVKETAIGLCSVADFGIDITSPAALASTKIE